MTKIIYPTLSLFVYDLGEGLGYTPKKIEENHNKFWQKIAVVAGKAKHLNHIRDSQLNKGDREIEYEPLILENIEKCDLPWQNNTKVWCQDQLIYFQTIANDDLYHKGYYYPVRLNDTLGLLIDCSLESYTNSHVPTSTKCFTDLKKYIDEKRNNQPGNLGETWIISAALPTEANINPIDIAKDCYQAFIGVTEENIWDENLYSQGEILGGNFFELASDLNPSNQGHHVIIILYPNKDTLKKSVPLYHRWIELLCYRHKIISSFRQSRQSKQRLKEEYAVIYQGIRDIKQASVKGKNINKLRDILDNAQDTVSRYSLNLSQLNYQLKTIEINLDNYKILWEVLAKESMPSNLEELSKFSEYATNKYLKQVEKDIENLSPGMTLLEGLLNSINSVKTVIEIDQAQRDRNFQNTVGIIGIALACASIVASISTQFPNVVSPVTIFPADSPQPVVEPTVIQVLKTLKTPESWYAPFSSLVFSITAGIISGALAGMILLKGKGKFISIMISLIVLFLLVNIIF